MKRYPILLLLILSFFFSCASAEEAAPYTPGSITENLFAAAFERGDMLALDMQFGLTLAENADEVFGEDAELLRAVCEALESSTFTVAAGKIDGGLRVMLSGDYTSGAESASLNATLDLTHEGVAVSSSVIPGEIVSAKWETLLSLAGADSEEISVIMSLRDADLDALLAELLTQLQPMLDMAAQIAAPYAETVMAHIAALPMVINENVPAEYGYPAAATEMQIQITEKAVGNLIIALAEQLKQDATLCALLDMLLAEAATPDAPAPTAVQLCDAISQAVAEEFTDETLPLNIFVGMDAAGGLLYLNIIAENGDGTYFTINCITGKLAETDAELLNIDVVTLNAEQEILDGFSFVLASDVDEANPNVMSMELLLGGYADGAEILSFSLYTDNAEADYAGHSGYAGQLSMSFDALDGDDVVSMMMDAEMTTILTAADSEELVVVGSASVSAEGEEIPLTFEGGLLTEVVDGAPVATMTEAAQLPKLGIAEWQENYALYILSPDQQELTAVTLESASPETLEALANRAMESLQKEMNALFEMLPPELLEAAE